MPTDAGATKGIEKKKSKSKNPEYASYLLKISKQVHPDKSVAKDAMWVVNGVISDLLNRMIAKSNEMAAIEGKSTLKAKHAQAATNAILSGELARHGISAGTKASVQYEMHVPAPKAKAA